MLAIYNSTLMAYCFERCRAGLRMMRSALFVGVLALLVPQCVARERLTAGKPVVGKNADGQLEIFRVDANGELRHRRLKRATGDWSSWLNLAGAFLPDITVAGDAAGRLQIFAVDRASKEIKCIQQQETNSLEWSAWANLGGTVQAPVTVGQNLDGRLELFAMDAGGKRLLHMWQTNTRGGWSAWKVMAGSVKPGMVVPRNNDGRLELFGIGDDKRLVHCWQSSANASDDWSDWALLDGAIQPGFGVGRNSVGRLELFAVNTTNAAVVRIIQSRASDSRSWSHWEDFGGRFKDGLAVAQSGDGRTEIFAVNDDDGLLMHRWEKFSNGSDQWSPWTHFDTATKPYPAVRENEDGNLEVFAVDPDDENTILHRSQISSASDWLDWSSLDRRTFQYTSRIWQIDEGLPDNFVQAIAQTHDGYLWVGTRDGLARFDGVHFTVYDAKNTPQLKNSSITALCADRSGAFWIGTDGGGVVRLKDGKFVQFGKGEGLAGDNVRVIYQDKNDSIWIGTTTGLSQRRNETVKNFTTKDGLLSDVVSYIYQDRDGDLWIATGKGLNRLRSGGTMDSFNMPNGLPNDSVRGICQDSGGRIWIGSNNGLLWYNWYWGASFYAYNARYGLSDAFVSAICEDAGGNLWVGTYSGLNRFHEGRFYNVLDNEGLPFDRVNALFEDRNGSLWVGSKEGLVRLTPKKFFTYTRRQGLAHNNIMSVLQDQRGSMWIGTWGGGLDQLKNETITACSPTNFPAQDLILSLCEGHDGSVWIGADFDGGLTHLKNGAATHYSWKDGLPNAGIRVIHEDRAESLWIGTTRGLACLRAGKFTTFTNGLGGHQVRAICEDAAGGLWFGTDGGLVFLKDGKSSRFAKKDGLSDNEVISLYLDAENNLWIGTGAGGLNRFKDGHFTAYTDQQGLFSNEIFEILEDDESCLWMSCSRGVFRVRKSDLTSLDAGRLKTIPCVTCGKADGMESPQCNGAGKPAAWKIADGSLWFPTGKGLVTVDPKTITIDRIPSQVYIEQIIADKKPLIKGELTGARTVPPRVPVQVPPGRGDFEVYYTVLNLSAPDKSRFKYKLEGIDSDWVDAGGRRTAYYNNIPPGNYLFRVIACNKDGVWNEAGASLAMVFLPHYWQTWWFESLAVLLILGAASGTALYGARRKMKRKLALLEQRHAIERERGRIAKDIHDDLGSSLTRIMMLGERAEEGLGKGENVGGHVQKIVASSRHTVQVLDEIVWAVNPENDTLDGLIGYIGHYVHELFENTNMSCRLDVPMELSAITLPAELRHNLFLVVKEAFHNVLKHSHASEVRMQVAVASLRMQIVIQDNGIGFNLPSARKGNGLENMAKRMESLGGRFHVMAAPQQGTKLTIELELKDASPKR